MQESTGSISGLPLRVAVRLACPGGSSLAPAEVSLTGGRGASRVNGCVMVSLRVDPRERRPSARGFRGVWHDSRRLGRKASSLLTRGALAPPWLPRSTRSAAAGFWPSVRRAQLPSDWSHVGSAWTATEDVRRWAMRSRLFQPESAEGQRQHRASVRSAQQPEPGASQDSGRSTVAVMRRRSPSQSTFAEAGRG